MNDEDDVEGNEYMLFRSYDLFRDVGGTGRSGGSGGSGGTGSATGTVFHSTGTVPSEPPSWPTPSSRVPLLRGTAFYREDDAYLYHRYVLPALTPALISAPRIPVFPVLRYDDEEEEDDDLQGMLEQYVLSLSLQEYQPSFHTERGPQKIIFHEVILPEQGLCVICQETYAEDPQNRVGRVVCGHVFHVDCIRRLQEFHFRCPCCRRDCTAASP